MAAARSNFFPFADPEGQQPLRRDALSEELFVAMREGEMAKIEALVRKGADPNARDDAGFTVLMVAVREKRLGAVLALLAGGANADLQGPSDETALILAASGGSEDIARALIAAGAACDKDTPAEARRAGHYALAHSLEYGELRRLYEEAQRHKQGEHRAAEKKKEATALTHLFDAIAHSPAREEHCSEDHWYSKFISCFMKPAEQALEPPAETLAEKLMAPAAPGVFEKMTSYAKRTFEPLFR